MRICECDSLCSSQIKSQMKRKAYEEAGISAEEEKRMKLEKAVQSGAVVTSSVQQHQQQQQQQAQQQLQLTEQQQKGKL